jgi:hypothetical protein
MTKNLLSTLNESGLIHMTPAIINEKFIIRFCVNSKKASIEDIRSAYEMISRTADQVINESTHLPIIEITSSPIRKRPRTAKSKRESFASNRSMTTPLKQLSLKQESKLLSKFNLTLGNSINECNNENSLNDSREV